MSLLSRLLWMLPPVLTSLPSPDKKKPSGQPEIDRTSVNSWGGIKEFQEGRETIKQSHWAKETCGFVPMDRGLSLFSGPWIFLKEGYEVYTIVDAVGGTSRLAHETAPQTDGAGGVQLTSVTQYICELQRTGTTKKPFLFSSRGCWITDLFFGKHSKKNSITGQKASGYKRMKTDLSAV